MSKNTTTALILIHKISCAPERLQRLVDHAWARHAPETVSSGTKFPTGTTQADVEGIVRTILGLPRESAPSGSIDQQLVERLDGGLTALVVGKRFTTDLHARIGSRRYSVSLARRAGADTAYPIDGEGIERLQVDGKNKITRRTKLPLSKVKIAGWDKPNEHKGT